MSLSRRDLLQQKSPTGIQIAWYELHTSMTPWTVHKSTLVSLTKPPYYRLYNNWVQPKPTLFPVKELNWKNNNNKTLLVVCLKLLQFFFVLTEKQISGHHFNDLHFIQVKNNPRSCEVNLCNCVRSLKKFRTSTGSRFFFFFFFFFVLVSGMHCVHNCEDHSSLYFISAVLIYDLFHIHLSHYISSFS